MSDKLSNEQLSKIHTIAKEVADGLDVSPQRAKDFLKAHYAQLHGKPFFSCKDLTKEDAGHFIDWLINFCMDYDLYG